MRLVELEEEKAAYDKKNVKQNKKRKQESKHKTKVVWFVLVEAPKYYVLCQSKEIKKLKRHVNFVVLNGSYL